MLLLYHIWLKTVWIASPKEHEKKRWKRESAGQKESPVLTKIMKEITIIYVCKIAFLDLAKGLCSL